MPAIRHSSKRKPPPDGFEDIENDLLIFANKMKDAQNKPPPSGPRHQAQWEIFQISHQRSRYVYELYYEKEAISKKLYDWLLKNGYADAMLIAKWKKQGYEKLCCLRCIQTKETNFNSTCICRVPRAEMKGDEDIECLGAHSLFYVLEKPALPRPKRTLGGTKDKDDIAPVRSAISVSAGFLLPCFISVLCTVGDLGDFGDCGDLGACCGEVLSPSFRLARRRELFIA
ncbi:hypothetical protein HG531_011754 [Fusarium graminearum]|nr:hypothetical protein HG531_011754 [Fusarium graminearum]